MCILAGCAAQTPWFGQGVVRLHVGIPPIRVESDRRLTHLSFKGSLPRRERQARVISTGKVQNKGSSPSQGYLVSTKCGLVKVPAPQVFLLSSISHQNLAVVTAGPSVPRHGDAHISHIELRVQSLRFEPRQEVFTVNRNIERDGSIGIGSLSFFSRRIPRSHMAYCSPTFTHRRTFVPAISRCKGYKLI